MTGLEGEQRQRAPAYSAKHIGGERSHRLARRGAAVEPPEATVTVYRIEPIAWASPELTFRAAVSTGTYLRSIARDLGSKLYPRPVLLGEDEGDAKDADKDKDGKPARGKPARASGATAAVASRGNGGGAPKPPPSSPRKKKKRSGRRR